VFNITEDIYNSIIKNNYGRDKLKKIYNLSDNRAREIIAIANYLKDNNLPLINDPKYHNNIEKDFSIKGNKFKVACMSDLHFGSREMKLKQFNAFMEHTFKENVDIYLIAGDILDGTKVYKGQEYEQYSCNLDEQLKLFLNNFPVVSKCYFILGNHDYSFYKSVGVNIGDIIEKERKDLKYIGVHSGNININEIPFELWHGSGASGYALTYKLQKKIESYMSGKKPRFLISGHWHQSCVFTTRNVTALHAGCFQGDTILLKALALQPQIGGWILDITHENKEVKSIKSEFIQFYE